MADNTLLNAGTGGDTIATDDIGGVKYQRVKIIHGPDGTNNGDVSFSNPLPMEIVGAMTEFGALAVAQRSNQVEASFASSGTLSTLLTLANTGSGASDWGSTTPGMATFSTGVTNPSTAKGTSLTTVTYRAGEEVYAYFTAAFTTGVAGTFQRVGLTDEAEGFFMGYEGTAFSVSYITNSVVTSVAQASWNVDPCQSGAGSKFTSGGAVATLDPTKLNLYRIRFGWLGIGPAEFEVMSPDGIWVLAHQFRFPNSQATPSIRTPNLPMKIWLSSTGSNLVVKSSCIAAGNAQQMTQKGSQPLYAMPTQDMIDAGRVSKMFTVSGLAATATTETGPVTYTISSGLAATTTGTTYTVTTGKTLRIQQIIVSARNSTGTTASPCTVRIRAATSGAITTTSPLQAIIVAGTPASAQSTFALANIPDGFELPSGSTMGITIQQSNWVTASVVATFDITVIGFEY